MNDEFKFPDAEDVKDEEVRDESREEIEVEVVDDTPDRDKGRKPLDREVADPSDEELEAYSDGVKKRIKELTHARHDERRGKEAVLREKQELERMTQALLDENRRLKQQYSEGAKQFAETANSAADMEVAAARKMLKEAHEAFDTDAIVAAQEALADAKLKQQQAKNFRPPALQAAEEVVQTPNQPQRATQPDAKTLRWQARNQWFGADGHEEMTSFSLGLHQKLVNSGVDPRSDDYYERIDSRMRSVFPEYFGNTPEKPKSVEGSRKPAAAVVAPGTRSVGPKKVQLTETQVALAKRYGLTPQQYAAEVLKLERQNG